LSVAKLFILDCFNRFVKIYVMDSSAIFQRKAIYKNMITVPEVVSEVIDEQSSVYLSVKNLKIEEASASCLKKIERIAKRTGDIYKLSDTDLKILAKALDEKEKGNDVILVTDDYAIQNVAKKIGIKFESVIQKGISKEFNWIKVCKGCGRRLTDDICPICGSEAVIRRIKNDSN